MKNISFKVLQGQYLEYNLDKWSTKKGSNILFITGISGSGKTNFAEKLAEKTGAIHVSTDKWIQQESSDWLESMEDIITEEVLFNIQLAIEAAKEDYANIYIIEGIILYLLNPEQIRSLELINFPTIVTDVSMNYILNSTLKKARERGQEDISFVMEDEFVQRFLFLGRFINELEKQI